MFSILKLFYFFFSGAPRVTNFGKPSMPEILVLVITSLPSEHPDVHTYVRTFVRSSMYANVK